MCWYAVKKLTHLLWTSKQNLKKCRISVEEWESLAADRPCWRSMIRDGVSLFESQRRADRDIKRQKRKSRIGFMGVDLFSKLRGSISIPSPASPSPFLICPSPPFPSPSFPSLPRSGPSNTARGSGERCKLPQRGPKQSLGRKRILGAFRPVNRVWWQQCDMSHNHSLIINIHYFSWMECSLKLMCR